MRITVTADRADLDASASPIFGRCHTYIFVDTDTMAFETVGNPAIAAAGGAGIQAAQFVVERGADAVVSGNVGPNAFGVLQSADVPVYLFNGGTVREAIEAYKAGKLNVAGNASAPAHAGMGTGAGTRLGRGLGAGRGMGRGRGTPVPETQPAAPAVPRREEEIVDLKAMTSDLRKQLAEAMARLDRLERSN